MATPGEAIAWVAALVYALTSFMGWYSASTAGISVSVIGWHTGALGKLVFFVGIAVLVLLFLRLTGVDLPPAVPAGIVVAVAGTVATIIVVVRLIDVPDRFAGFGRGVGIWISLIAALAIVVAGLVQAGEELESPAQP